MLVPTPVPRFSAWMTETSSQAVLTQALIDPLYAEALGLADEARGYFSQAGQDDRLDLEPMERVLFSCESLKVTTRLMHVISWLMVGKAVAAGEMTPEEASVPERRLGFVEESNEVREPRLTQLPSQARALVRRSVDLYERVSRIEASLAHHGPGGARALQDRLGEAF